MGKLYEEINHRTGNDGIICIFKPCMCITYDM